MALTLITITDRVLLLDGSAPTRGEIRARLSQSAAMIDGATVPYLGGEVLCRLAAGGYLPGTVVDGVTVPGVPLTLAANDALDPADTWHDVDITLWGARGERVQLPPEKWQLASTPTTVPIGSVTRLSTTTGILGTLRLALATLAGMLRLTNDLGGTADEPTVVGAHLDTTLSANPAYVEGRLFYDSTAHTLAYYNENAEVTVNVGQEMLVRVHNDTGVTIPNGKVVLISGSHGSLRPRIVLADASSEALSHGTIGLTTCEIADNADGYVTTEGMVNDVNTAGLTEGLVLWLSTTPGEFTTTRPTAPDHATSIGVVIRAHATLGKIWCKVTDGFEVDELHDVDAASPSDGDLLVYRAATGLWTHGRDAYDLLFSVPGTPGDAELLARTVAVRAVTLPAGLTGSRGSVGTAPAAEATITIKHDGTDVGTATISAAGVVTFAAAADIALVAGSVLSLHAQATADAALADIAITLVGAA